MDGWHRAVKERVQRSSGWLTLYYRLPSHLPDFSCLTLRSIEVAAVAPANPPATLSNDPPAPSDDPCLGYVGQTFSIQSISQCVHETTAQYMMFAADLTVEHQLLLHSFVCLHVHARSYQPLGWQGIWLPFAYVVSALLHSPAPVPAPALPLATVFYNFAQCNAHIHAVTAAIAVSHSICSTC